MMEAYLFRSPYRVSHDRLDECRVLALTADALPSILVVNSTAPADEKLDISKSPVVDIRLEVTIQAGLVENDHVVDALTPN